VFSKEAVWFSARAVNDPFLSLEGLLHRYFTAIDMFSSIILRSSGAAVL